MSTAQPIAAIRCCLAQSKLAEARLKLASWGASFCSGATDASRSAMWLLPPGACRHRMCGSGTQGAHRIWMGHGRSRRTIAVQPACSSRTRSVHSLQRRVGGVVTNRVGKVYSLLGNFPFFPVNHLPVISLTVLSHPPCTCATCEPAECMRLLVARLLQQLLWKGDSHLRADSPAVDSNTVRVPERAHVNARVLPGFPRDLQQLIQLRFHPLRSHI